jgi:branched-chain amino acid transport system permease protein
LSRKRFLAAFPAAGLIPALGVLCVIVHYLGGPLLEGALTEALVYMVMVIALYVFIGNSGIISFGHVTFAMIGAYASAWQTCCAGMRGVFMPGLPDWLLRVNMPSAPAAIVAALLAAAFATLIGVAISRLGAFAAPIGLLSLLFVIKTIYENWTSVTAGQSSIVGLPLDVDIWTALLWVFAAIVVAQLYARSPWGLRLRASREDEAAARASGVTIWKERLIAFVLSAFLFAIGGALFGHFLGTLAVSEFWLDMTFLTLAMLVVGGMRSLTGAVVGTLVVSALRELLRAFERGIDIGSLDIHAPEGTQEIWLAVILLVILIFRPQGLVGDRELGRPAVK